VLAPRGEDARQERQPRSSLRSIEAHQRRVREHVAQRQLAGRPAGRDRAAHAKERPDAPEAGVERHLKASRAAIASECQRYEVRRIVIVMTAFPGQRPNFIGAIEARRQQR